MSNYIKAAYCQNCLKLWLQINSNKWAFLRENWKREQSNPEGKEGKGNSKEDNWKSNTENDWSPESTEAEDKRNTKSKEGKWNSEEANGQGNDGNEGSSQSPRKKNKKEIKKAMKATEVA